LKKSLNSFPEKNGRKNKTVLLVALTGGIASGKSVIATVLQIKGCTVHSADAAAHELMEPLKPAWKKIVAHFGLRVLNPDRTINRAVLGQIVFSLKSERAFLNNLIHPLILREKRRIIRRLEKEGQTRIFVSEAALTVEAGFAKFFDRVIVSSCRTDVQVKRLMERDGISRKEAEKKISSQMPLKDKLAYADYVIDTSGTLAETVEQTERVYAQLMRDYELKTQKAVSRKT